MRKIICFTDNLGAGGAQRQLVGLACMLKSRGYDVTVLLYYDTPFYKSQLDEAGVESVVVGNTSNPIKRLWALYRYFRKQSCDTLISYQETPSLIVCIFRLLFKWRKLIVSERNTTQQLTKRDKLRFWLYRFADVIVPNSYSQADFICNNFADLKSKVVPITNFVDTDKFLPIKKSKLGNKLVVVASNKPEKNFVRLIESVALVKNKHIPLQIDWYGIRESAIPQYKKIIEENGVSDIVTIYPPQKNIQSIYQNADYFCLPSLFEGFPNALCEAMSCGVPVVCSNVCDNPHIVQDGQEGYLFDPKDIEQIAESIEQITQLSDEEYEMMSMRNRERAVELFSMTAFMEKYIAILEK